MQMPCANPVNCPGTDRPVINVTAEEPDVIKTFGYGYFGNGFQRICEEVDQQTADICALVTDPDEDQPNPPPPRIFTSNAQSCTVTCPDLTTQTYSVVAGSAAATSQAAADAAARALACQLAQMQCAGPVTVFLSIAQTCNVTCANGQLVSYTAPAGMFSGASQAEANAAAYVFACEVAALLCTDLPPIPGGGGPGGGAGNPPTPPVRPRYGNSPQTCVAVCPGGGIMNYTVPAGTFIAESLAAANAIAASYACRQAQLNSVCLGSINSEACVGEFYSQVLAVSGLTEPIVWSIISGSLPPGVVLADDLLQGSPTTAGSYTFTLQVSGVSDATGENVSTNRSFSIKVMEISTAAALPNGDVDAPYAQALAAAGNTGSLTWSIISGTLPDGLTLHPATGVISGTPTEDGDFVFVVGITDTDEQQCSKAFTLEIEAVAVMPVNWWKLEEAAGDRVDSIAGALLSPGGASPTNAAAKILNGSRHVPAPAQASFLGSSALDPLLAYLGTGMDVCGWLYIDADNLLSDAIQVTFVCSGYTMFTFSSEAWDNRFHFEARGDATGFDAIDIPFVFVMGQSIFWRVTFDSSTGIWSIAFDGGAANPCPTVHTIAAKPSGQLFLTGLPSSVLEARFDEVGIFQPNLDAAGLAYVYNGGTGRTFG